MPFVLRPVCLRNFRRPGHDRRYAIDVAKIDGELGWQPAHTFEAGIRETVKWYLAQSRA